MASENKAALITGATSGIGRSFAFAFAQRQYDLILTGRRKEILYAVAEEIRETFGVSVEVVIAELSDDGDIQKILKLIEKQSNLEVLVNNAGYGIGRVFLEESVLRQLEMIKVHITAPLMFMHTALPEMMRRRKGTIINVSSLAAFTPARTNIMYSSTKAFMLNFSESLYLDARHHGVRVQCLCPGYTHSDFHAKTGDNAFPKSRRLVRWMDPDKVVDCSLHCLDRGRTRCIPGFTNRLTVALLPFVPRRIYYAFISRQQQEPKATAEATKSDLNTESIV